MKLKYLLIPTTIVVSAIPVFAAISCSSSSSDYATMSSWSIDVDKVNTLKESGWESFNSEAVSIDKLKKVTKLADYVDRYTTAAFDEGWFDKIEFLTDKNNKPTNLSIQLKQKQGDKKCPYRLPNGGLTWKR